MDITLTAYFTFKEEAKFQVHFHALTQLLYEHEINPYKR